MNYMPNSAIACLCALLINLAVTMSVTLLVSAAGSEQQPSPIKQQVPPEKVVLQHQSQTQVYHTDCSKLLPGQFLCLDLNIDPKTQQPRDCHKELLRANVTCEAAPGIICKETNNSTFTGTIPCKYV